MNKWAAVVEEEVRTIPVRDRVVSKVDNRPQFRVCNSEEALFAPAAALAILTDEALLRAKQSLCRACLFGQTRELGYSYTGLYRYGS